MKNNALEKMYAKASKQHSTKQRNLLDEKHNFFPTVVPDAAPEVSALRPLEAVVTNIQSLASAIRLKKHELLKELYYLYSHWDLYTEPAEMETYRGAQGFQRFAQERLQGQEQKTSASDLRIIQLVKEQNRAELLEQSGHIYALRRIAALGDKANPDRAWRKKRELLDKVGQVKREELEAEIRRFHEETRRATQHPPPATSKSWKLKLDRTNRSITFSRVKSEQLEKLNELLTELDDELLETFLHQVQERRLQAK
jgi:hypothetical protein